MQTCEFKTYEFLSKDYRTFDAGVDAYDLH